MKKCSSLICLILVSSLLVSFHTKATSEKDKIRWLVIDYPPFEIVSGPDAGTGMTDGMRDFVQRGLPQYQHESPIVSNNARLERLFKERLSCHAGLIPNENEARHIYYSIPYGMAYPFVFITTKEKHASVFNNAETLSLKEALKSLDASLTVPPRTLGPIIDPIINNNMHTNKITVRMSMVTAGKIFEMLIKRRTDYLIAYSSEAIYWGRNGKFDQLAFMNIEELNGKFITGGMGCSKSEEGRKVIEEINSYLVKHRNNREYLEGSYFKWLPQRLHQEFLREYESSVLTDFSSNIDQEPAF